jgi:hypothetical protein
MAFYRLQQILLQNGRKVEGIDEIIGQDAFDHYVLSARFYFAVADNSGCDENES